ncbi:MAG TPA: hypothetical protein VG101_16225 [Puia sp.]|jgi:hypothetical protein|nr:hypothetical protein [Puia sp.]
MRIAKRYMILLAFVAGSALLYFILQIVLNLILTPIGVNARDAFVYWAEAVFYSFCTCFVLVLGGSIAGMIVSKKRRDREGVLGFRFSLIYCWLVVAVLLVLWALE